MTEPTENSAYQTESNIEPAKPKTNSAAKWIFLLILAACLLAFLCVPIITPQMPKGSRIVCGSKVKGLATAMLVYAHDYDGKVLPTGDKWYDLLIQEADVGSESFRCPKAKDGRGHYAVNRNAYKMGMGGPADMVLLFETWGGWNMVGGPEDLTTEHHGGEGCNVAFCDGHVEFVKREELKNLKWDVEEIKSTELNPVKEN